MTTSAGRSTTSTPPGSAGRGRVTGPSSATSTPARHPGPSRGARSSSTTRRPATAGSAAARQASRASKPPSRTRTTARSRWHWPGSRVRTRWCSGSGGSRSSTWETSWRCSTTGRTSTPPSTPTTTGGCTDPRMPWSLAEQRHDPSTVAGRAFASMQHLARTRAGLAALHASVETELFETGNQAVVVAVRRHAAGTLVEVFNVSGAGATGACRHRRGTPAGAVARRAVCRPGRGGGRRPGPAALRRVVADRRHTLRACLSSPTPTSCRSATTRRRTAS